MKYLAFLLLLVFPFVALSGQSAKKKIERLQTENDSLRLELQKCQNAPMQRLTETLDSPKFGENPNYGREELHAKLLPQIKAKSEEKYGKALNIIISTDAFLKYCEALKTELTQQTGGVDANGQPIGARDNKTPTRFFIEEKRGAELKSKWRHSVQFTSTQSKKTNFTCPESSYKWSHCQAIPRQKPGRNSSSRECR
jgi:hypothetical protein